MSRTQTTGALEQYQDFLRRRSGQPQGIASPQADIEGLIEAQKSFSDYEDFRYSNLPNDDLVLKNKLASDLMGTLQGANRQGDIPLSEVPRNFLNELELLKDGITGLIGMGFQANQALFKDLGNLVGLSEPGGFFETARDLFTNEKGTRTKFANEFLEPVWEGIKEEVGELVDDPFEAIKKRPFAQLSNVAAVLSLGGASFLKAGGALTNLGKLGKAGNIISKTGRVLAKTGNAIDPLAIPMHFVRGAKAAGRFQEMASRLQQEGHPVAARFAAAAATPARLVQSVRNQKVVGEVLGKERFRFGKILRENVDELQKRFSQLSPDEIDALQPVIEGFATIDDAGRLAVSVPEFADQLAGRIPENVRGLLPSREFAETVDFLRGLAKEEAALLGFALDKVDEVVYQPLAIATGLTKMGSKPTKEVIDQLKQHVAPFYFPHLWEQQITPKKLMGRVDEFLGLAQPFTRKRLGRETYIKNGVVAYVRHRAQFAQFQAAMEAAQELVERGIPEGFAKVAPVGTPLPKGWSYFNLDGFRKYHQHLFSGQEEFLRKMVQGVEIDDAMGFAATRIADEMADDVITAPKNLYMVRDSVIKPFINTHKGLTNPFMRLYDKSTNMWRNMVLSWSPRWVVNNVAGNTILNTMAGVGPMSYFQAMPLLMTRLLGKMAPKWLQAGAKELDAVIPEQVRYGFLAEQNAPLMQLLGKNETRLLQTPARPRFLAHINTAIEDFMRSANYISAAKRGARTGLLKGLARRAVGLDDEAGRLALPERLKRMTPREVDAAVNRVHEFLFDFSKLLPFEQRVMRRIIPFWSWYRNISLFTLMFPLRHPKKFVIFRQLAKQAEDALRRDDAPEWLRQAIPITVDDQGNQVYLNLRGANPFSDFFTFGLQNLNPHIKVAVEQMTGRDTLRDRFFSSPDTFEIPFRAGRFRFDPQGRLEKVRVTPNLTTHALRQIPHYELLEDLLLPASRYDTSTLLAPQPIPSPALRKLKKLRENITAARRKVVLSPKGALLKMKRLREMAALAEELEGKIATATVFDPATVSFREVPVAFAKDRWLESLKMVGVSLFPVDVDEQRARNLDAKISGIRQLIRNFETTQPETADLLRQMVDNIEEGRQRR